MKNKAIKKVAEAIIFPIIAVGVMFAVWAIAATATKSELILPSISSTFNQLGFYLSNGSFYLAAAKSAAASLIAFALSLLLAIAAASLALISVKIKRVLNTIIGGVRAIPTISVIIVFIIWFNSNITPVLVTMLIIFPSLYSSINAGLEGIDRELEETAKIYALKLRHKIFSIYLPLCAPSVLESMASNISLAVKLTVAAELLAQTSNSLGMLMQQSRLYFETARLFSLTIVAVLISALFESGIRLIKKLSIDY